LLRHTFEVQAFCAIGNWTRPVLHLQGCGAGAVLPLVGKNPTVGIFRLL